MDSARSGCGKRVILRHVPNDIVVLSGCQGPSKKPSSIRDFDRQPRVPPFFCLFVSSFFSGFQGKAAEPAYDQNVERAWIPLACLGFTGKAEAAQSPSGRTCFRP